MWQLPGNLGNGFLVQLGPIGNANQVTVGPTSALIEQFPFAIAIPEAVPSATYPGTDNPVLVKGPYDVAYTVTVEGQEPQQYGGTTNPILSVFDTGTPETVFPGSGIRPIRGQLPVGSTVSATFINALDPSDPLLWSFTVGTTPAVNMAAYSDAGSSADEKIILGLNIYNDFDVLFDAHTQLIYLRPNGGEATVNLHSVTTTGAQSYQQGNVILDGTYTIDRGTFSVAGTTTLGRSHHRHQCRYRRGQLLRHRRWHHRWRAGSGRQYTRGHHIHSRDWFLHRAVIGECHRRGVYRHRSGDNHRFPVVRR